MGMHELAAVCDIFLEQISGDFCLLPIGILMKPQDVRRKLLIPCFIRQILDGEDEVKPVNQCGRHINLVTDDVKGVKPSELGVCGSKHCCSCDEGCLHVSLAYADCVMQYHILVNEGMVGLNRDIIAPLLVTIFNPFNRRYFFKSDKSKCVSAEPRKQSGIVFLYPWVQHMEDLLELFSGKIKAPFAMIKFHIICLVFANLPYTILVQ